MKMRAKILYSYLFSLIRQGAYFLDHPAVVL